MASRLPALAFDGATYVMSNIVERSRIHLKNVLRVQDSEADAIINELLDEIEGLYEEIGLLKMHQCKCPD